MSQPVTTSLKGAISEALVLAKLLTEGWAVSIPWGHSNRYDFIIERYGIMRRVQVKTGRLRNGAILFNAVSTHDKKRYDGEADLFCVYCPDNHKFYLLNVAGLAKQVSLRVSAPKNNQKKKMLWARNYEI